jgi:hypothetical protein
MSIHTRSASALAIGAAVIWSASAHAADNTRYLSITGSNANACTLAAPCRTLHKGMSATPEGGELRILDSGFYGNNATIKKSLTITGNGNTVYLGVPITIDQADAVVALRGLVLDGQGTVDEGISIVQATAVHVERCVVHSFTSAGIIGISSTSDVQVFVTHSISRDNNFGFFMSLSGAPRVTLEDSQFNNNSDTGVIVFSGQATIRRSNASGNGQRGIFTTVPVSVTSTAVIQNDSLGLFVNGGALTIESSIVRGNGTGLFVGTTSTARISNSIFTDNGIGIDNRNIVRTLGNNMVDGNTNDAVAGTVQAITAF